MPLRRSFTITIKCIGHPERYIKNISPRISNCRNIYTKALTKNIYYISNSDVPVKFDSDMKLNNTTNKPTCIMMNWLLDTNKARMKYVNWYLNEGFDVITVTCRPWQLIWPRKGAQVIGMDLLKIISNYDVPYVLHGFSVGGYVWSETMVHATKDPQRYQPVLDTIRAQVWDSVTDITEATVGIPIALFPNSMPMQYATRQFIKCYLKAFYNIATVHYERACNMYYKTPCKAPSLFLLSSTDPVGKEERIRKACDIWIDMGIKCTFHCWPDSSHVAHYIKHPEEYLSLLRKHLHDKVPEVYRN